MFSILAAVLFSMMSVLTLLVAFGLPFGEFTMGGQYKVLPAKFRVMAGISFVVQLFAIIVILQAGGYIPLWFSIGITRNICTFFSVYLILNTIMNVLSTSKKEKFVMTPLSLVLAICFSITVFTI